MAGAAAARPVPTLSPDQRDAIYWKNEAQRAFRERDEVKRSLEAIGGPATYWRDQAKEASKKHGDALRQVGGLRQAEQEQRQRAIEFSEQLDALKDHVAGQKRALWEIWSALVDGDPMKSQLWEAWAAL